MKNVFGFDGFFTSTKEPDGLFVKAWPDKIGVFFSSVVFLLAQSLKGPADATDIPAS